MHEKLGRQSRSSRFQERCGYFSCGPQGLSEVSGKLREKELPARSHLYLSYKGNQGKELTSVTVEG